MTVNSPSRVGGQGHFLNGVGPVAGDREHLGARQNEFDRPLDNLGGECGDEDMRPGPQRLAKGPADEWRNNFHVFDRDFEDRRRLLLNVVHPLRLVVKREFRPVPNGHRGVHFHRGVILGRDGVSLLHLHGSILPGLNWIAALESADFFLDSSSESGLPGINP